jgi:hypothetical protein
MRKGLCEQGRSGTTAQHIRYKSPPAGINYPPPPCSPPPTPPASSRLRPCCRAAAAPFGFWQELLAVAMAMAKNV